MAAVVAWAERNPNGSITAVGCARGRTGRDHRCVADVGPLTFERGWHLVLTDGSLHHAVIGTNELTWWADRVTSRLASRVALDGKKPLRVDGTPQRPAAVPETDAEFSARVAAEVKGLAQERDLLRGVTTRVVEAPPAPVPLDLNVDPKGQVIR